MNRLVLAIQASRMTAKELDRLTNGEINESNLRRWMKGKGQPEVKNLLKLCEHLRVSSDWLIGLVESEDPVPPPAPWDGVTERRRLVGSVSGNGD